MRNESGLSSASEPDITSIAPTEAAVRCEIVDWGIESTSGQVAPEQRTKSAGRKLASRKHAS